MITATFLTCNQKKSKHCFFTDKFKACLNCCNKFIKTVQFEASVIYINIYFTVFITEIWNYLQKYYKMAWLKHAFGTRMFTKFTIAN